PLDAWLPVALPALWYRHPRRLASWSERSRMRFDGEQRVKLWVAQILHVQVGEEDVPLQARICSAGAERAGGGMPVLVSVPEKRPVGNIVDGRLCLVLEIY